jgi:hypothetical protein
MLGKIVLIAVSIISIGCTNSTKLSGGYVTSQDPIHHECIDGKLWAVNNSGKADLEEQCN